MTKDKRRRRGTINKGYHGEKKIKGIVVYSKGKGRLPEPVTMAAPEDLIAAGLDLHLDQLDWSAKAYWMPR